MKIKKIRSLLMMLVVLIGGTSSFDCCDPDPEPEHITRVLVEGKAKATPSIVKNGDVVKLSIADAVYSSSKPIIHYLIDGKEVAMAENTPPYEAYYKVEGLAVGEHILSVNTTSSETDVVFENKVSNSLITVIQGNGNGEPDNPIGGEEEMKLVNITLTSIGYLSKDLTEFVTPVLKYTDEKGEHTINITSDMWKEDPLTLPDGFICIDCDWEKKFDVNVIPAKAANMTFCYIPKNGVKVDAAKKYYVSNNFSIKGYSYAYKGVHIEIDASTHIDITINIGGESAEENQYLIDGSKMTDYVKALCASASAYSILLNEDGNLSIEPVGEK